MLHYLNSAFLILRRTRLINVQPCLQHAALRKYLNGREDEHNYIQYKCLFLWNKKKNAKKKIFTPFLFFFFVNLTNFIKSVTHRQNTRPINIESLKKKKYIICNTYFYTIELKNLYQTQTESANTFSINKSHKFNLEFWNGRCEL